MTRNALRSEIIAASLTVFACTSIYVLFFVRRFMDGSIVMGGDTQMMWSFHYLALFSLTHFREFLWWDPTAYGGWPAYFYWISAWTNHLGPYSLPSIAALCLADWLSPLQLNRLIVLQKTVYFFTLNLVAVMLIARGLVRRTPARAFVAVTFTLCEITFHGFRDAALYEALPGPLFYIAALIHFNNHRTPSSFLLFVGATGLMLANLSYGFLQSSFYWTLVFTVLVLLLFPGLLASAYRVTTGLLATKAGAACVLAGVFLLLSGFWAFYAPAHYNIGHLLRVSAAGPVDYLTGLGPGWNAATKYGIVAGESWTNFLFWVPLPDLHDHALRYDVWGAGVDHRYIGLATLPLLLVAAAYAAVNRYVIACFLTFFICGAFLVYTVNNPLFAVLIDHSMIFKNIRTLAHTMPREGPALFLIFTAGIGFDALLRRHLETFAVREGPRPVLGGLLALALVVAAVMALLAAVPAFAAVKHGLGHTAIYLALFSGVLMLFAMHRGRMPRRGALALAWSFVALVFMDLAISAGAYWDRGGVWFKNAGVHRLREITSLPPIARENQIWSREYNGAVHSPPGGPWYGTREWLVLASRPAWQPTLENWNPDTRTMTEYPAFRFYTHAVYVPFEAIATLDRVQPPVSGPYGGLKGEGEAEVLVVNGARHPVEQGFAGYVEHVHEHDSGDGVTLTGWAIDERTRRPAERVVLIVGDRLWGMTRPRAERVDIAALGSDYLHSGFRVLGHGVPKTARTSVRAFAILADGSARELRYADRYPYPVKRTRGPDTLPLDALPRPLPELTFYLHDQAAAQALPQGAGRADVEWKTVLFTPNRVDVETRSARDSYLVYLDNYDRFWRATIDGREVPIYRANFTYKAILLPAGSHRVSFHYDPWPVKLAWVVFYAVLALFLCATLLAWRRRRVPPASGTR